MCIDSPDYLSDFGFRYHLFTCRRDWHKPMNVPEDRIYVVFLAVQFTFAHEGERL